MFISQQIHPSGHACQHTTRFTSTPAYNYSIPTTPTLPAALLIISQTAKNFDVINNPLLCSHPIKKNKKQKTGPCDLKKKQKITKKHKNAVLQFRYPEKL